MNKIFFLFSIMLLFLLALTAYQEHEPEWEKYQKNYYRLLIKKAKTITGKEIFNHEIKQDWLPEIARTDRCRTCHLGVENPDFSDAEQPYKTHPDFSRHPYSRFGCTICHGGQGRATTTREAHGEEENWEFPLLIKGVLEGACGKCHLGTEVPDAPILSAGRKLMDKSACTACHKIEGAKEHEKIGWNLVGIGSKVGPEWLVQWLKNPKNYLPKTSMPNFHLSDEEIEAITAFLMASRDEFISKQTLREYSEAEAEELYESGAIRFRESRCISCHSVDGRGGNIGPDLSGIGSKVKKEWLINWLENPKNYFPNTKMPQFSFPEKDIYALAEYISEEFILYDEFEPIKLSLSDTLLIKKGAELTKKYGCYGCHKLPQDIKGGEIGPELTLIGSKEVSKLDFGKTGIDRSLPNWLFVKIRQPRIFSKALKMPDYQFTEEEAVQITAALMSFTRKDIIHEYLVVPEEKSLFQPTGDFKKVIEKYRCLTCHTIRGQGGDLAPDLSYEGSMVQPEWLDKYLHLPYAVRPTLIERMPRLKITDEETRIISGYMKIALQSDDIPKELFKNIRFTSSEVEKGKELFYNKFACQSCHIIEGKGGYFGPTLDRVGSRLTPEWTYTRLKNPQIFDPDIIEPNYGMSDDEARLITAFLMSRKE